MFRLLSSKSSKRVVFVVILQNDAICSPGVGIFCPLAVSKIF